MRTGPRQGISSSSPDTLRPWQSHTMALRANRIPRIHRSLAGDILGIATIAGGIAMLWSDLKFAVRVGLIGAPGLSAAAILALTLGIGPNAAIFSLVVAHEIMRSRRRMASG